MFPFIRQVAIGDHHVRRFCNYRFAYQESQLDDTVTAVERRQRVNIHAGLVQITRRGHVVLNIKRVLIERYRIFVTDGVFNLRVVLLRIVNDQCIEMVIQLIRQVLG